MSDPGRVCEHGSLRRSCGICLRDEIIAELENNLSTALRASKDDDVEIETLHTKLAEAIPIDRIESQIADIKQNGIDVAALGEPLADEGRCRELCAMYLGEFITAYRLSQRLDTFDKAMKDE